MSRTGTCGTELGLVGGMQQFGGTWARSGRTAPNQTQTGSRPGKVTFSLYEVL